MIREQVKGMLIVTRGMSRKLIKSKRGSGIVEVLMVIAIIVIVGALVIGLLKTFVPDFFSGMVKKAKAIFEI